MHEPQPQPQPQAQPQENGPRRRFRLKLIAGLAVLIIGMSATVWSNYYLRHKALRLVTLTEAFLVKGGPSRGPEIPVPESTPLYLHAAKPGPGLVPCSASAVIAAARTYRRIEIDVAFSSDLVPYLSHGDNISAISNSKAGHTEQLTASQLDDLILRDGARLMSFRSFESKFARSFDHIILDVKTSHSSARQKAESLFGMLGAQAGSRYVIISTSGPLLMWMRRLRPDIPVGCESYLSVSNWLSGFQLVSWPATLVSANRDANARRFGLKRLYWTAWDQEQLDDILSWAPEYAIVDLGGKSPPRLPPEWRKPGESK